MFIVSFATPKYEIEAYKLLDDLRSHKIPHEVHFIQGFDSWQEATHYKPAFIKLMIDKHNCAVIWLDADTEIREFPGLFDELKCDVAFNYFNDIQLCGGVFFFNSTPRARFILDEWDAENKTNPDKTDQENLQRVVERNPDLEIVRLPREYCTFDLCEDQSNPVLWSRQASRRLRDSGTQ